MPVFGGPGFLVGGVGFAGVGEGEADGAGVLALGDGEGDGLGLGDGEGLGDGVATGAASQRTAPLASLVTVLLSPMMMVWLRGLVEMRSLPA